MNKNKRYNPNPYNATHAALAFLLFWAAMAVSSFALFSVLKGVRDSGKTITDLTPYLCLESVVVAFALAAVTWIVSGIAKANPVSGGGYLSRKGLGMEKFMAAVGVCGMSVLLAPLAETVAWDFGVVRSVFVESSAGIDPNLLGNGGLLVLYVFVLVPLLPAVFEELLFRGVIMRGFSEWGKTAGIILSAAAFALAHGNTDQIVYQFLFGLAVGFLVMETKSLGVGMVAHFTNNFFVQALAMVESIPTEWKMAKVYVAIIGIMSVLIGLVCFVAAFLYFGRRFLHSQKHSEKACPETRATFVVNDEVAGTLEEETVWHQTGKLLARSENDGFFTLGGRSRIKRNKKSKPKTAVTLTAIAFVVAVTRIFLAFFGIL